MQTLSKSKEHLNLTRAPADSDALDELHYLNVNHSYSLEAERGKGLDIETVGGSVVGKLKHLLRTKLRRFLFGTVLDEYLRNEQQFHANLVRLLNKMNQTSAASRGLDADQLHPILHRFAEHDERLKVAEAVLRGLERIVAVAGRVGSETSPGNSQSQQPVFEKDYSYLLLENRFRGSEEEIERRLAIYVPEFSGARGPVLEIGSGRGELQNLFRKAGIKSYGIELDQAMIERSRADGFDVRFEDGIRHLESLPEKSLGGMIAVQVVEHLRYDSLRRLLELARSRVETGGIIITETIDTSSLVALSQNYFRDPTHTAPLHPETLRYLFELSGLEVLKVQKLSPFPAGFELSPIPAEAFHEHGQISAVNIANENIQKLNRLLYGHQDYSVVARVP